ncbi:MAG: sulfotransferase, partial [Pseudomonadales bacterium]
IDAVVAATNTQAFIDGSKDPIRARYLIESKLWDCSVITLIRDGRGFFNSYMRHTSAPMAEAVAAWQAKVQEMEHLQKIAGANSIVVRYEDLCQDPLTVVNRVLAAASLEPLSTIDFPLTNSNRHIFGNAMRLREIDAVVADEKWRAGLTQADLEVFYREAGEMNDRYGYAAH